ncbi:aminopeptidase M1-like [Cornus florida]|uniref:aminopeptidase M1-like n=1 Tax=Cornus florida TaxID=4283 RepID=UPI00289EFE03|nr:aminopeptidase M1-like [Cornus florida]
MEMKDEQSLQQFKGLSRLPKFAIPKRYDLALKPDLSACTFSGTVRIELSIVSPTKFLVLNALELDIGEVSFTDSQNQKCGPSDVVEDGDDEMLVLVFDQVLSVGDGVLGISFSGVLNEHLKGFYRGTYIDGDVKKNMAVTQFEAVDARMCFPCWDEPAFKATFKITVDVPSDLTALSNMPVIHEKLNGHLKTVCFEESPIMSTYLVAIVIGLFDYIEDTTADGIKVRAYCPVGKSDKGKFALSVAVKTLDLYTEYFSMHYPLPKLDMVAVPDFSGGAMENYGLIIYREIELLHDDLHSAAASKQRLVIVVAHEVAHQWFGNLVTMEWWTHLWLNEGFATWISYLATDSLFPEWKVWTQFLKVTTSGLHMDALENSHPVEVEVHRARSVLEIFDAISYEKGSSVIRMLQDYLGDDIFQKSLSSYMKKYACKNAKTDDLWKVLSEESGIQVNAMMDTWTKQQGYPVISVKFKDDILEFEQSQFLSSGMSGDGLWIVPITLCIGSYDKSKKFMLERKLDSLNLIEPCHFSDGTSSSFEKKDKDKLDEHSWVKLNIGQTGFFRVKYDEKLTTRLRKAMEDNCLSAVDKFGILDDTYALCEAGEVSLTSLLSLMDVYRKELDDIVLSRLVDICCSIAKISSDAIPRSVHHMKQLFINILLLCAERLGWDPVSGENHLNALLREAVLMALATFDHDKTHEEALKRFQTYLSDRNTSCLPVDCRRAAYIAVMRHTSTINRKGFESLLKLYREADAVHEKTQILRSMGSCPDPEIVLEVLNFMLSDQVREQDVVYLLGGLSLEGRETAWRWFKENWDLILNKYGAGMLLTRFVRDIITPFCSHEKADEIEAFFANRVTPAIAMNLTQSIEKVRIKARWVENIGQEEFLEELVANLACSG